MDSKDHFAALEVMCRERAALAQERNGILVGRSRGVEAAKGIS
jgi:hypothetical protein